MRTTSAPAVTARTTASSPLAASPTTSVPGSERSSVVMPARKPAWSSATSTRVTGPRSRAGSSGRTAAHARAPHRAGRRPRGCRRPPRPAPASTTSRRPAPRPRARRVRRRRPRRPARRSPTASRTAQTVAPACRTTLVDRLQRDPQNRDLQGRRQRRRAVGRVERAGDRGRPLQPSQLLAQRPDQTEFVQCGRAQSRRPAGGRRSTAARAWARSSGSRRGRGPRIGRGDRLETLECRGDARQCRAQAVVQVAADAAALVLSGSHHALARLGQPAGQQVRLGGDRELAGRGVQRTVVRGRAASRRPIERPTNSRPTGSPAERGREPRTRRSAASPASPRSLPISTRTHGTRSPSRRAPAAEPSTSGGTVVRRVPRARGDGEPADHRVAARSVAVHQPVDPGAQARQQRPGQSRHDDGGDHAGRPRQRRRRPARRPAPRR